ncbi:MAG: Gfo/Idh/MocA family oxidoreductase [Bryobacterales bacterium]|nr:Gfo/Idh/MocA family oxidoreductase [Bryobacterales bacterium]
MSENGISRRHFFHGALFAGAVPAGGFGSVPALTQLGYKSPNEKLNLAAIGAGGRGLVDLRSAAAGVENVVALADVDFTRAAPGFAAWPKAARYKDYRRMLDRQAKEIDAVVIATADHMHATCALACIEAGKHVYVEKPLTRTTWEALLLRDAAAKYPKVATQMGNQGYSHDATRVACEIIWSGEIGEVTEVHAWSGRPEWPLGMQKAPPPTQVPDALDWDLWLGGAAWRPYSAGDDDYKAVIAPYAGAMAKEEVRRAYAGFYCPFVWRGFFDFGTGHFGDWGVHVLGPANWALQLSLESLISVEVIKQEGTSPITYPRKSAVKYEFGPRKNMPPVTVYWEDNVQGDAYLPPGMSAAEARKIPGAGPQVGPDFGGRVAAGGGQHSSGYNCIFAGSKGYLGTSGRGEGVGLLPGSRWADYKLPNVYLARSPGPSAGDNAANWDISAHTHDWIRASKGGAPACSNFSIAGPFTAWVVLGAVAAHYQGKLLWDNARMRFSNNNDASRWIRPAFRKGWEIRL